MNDSTPSQAPADLREAIYNRVNEIQLELLDVIKSALGDGKIPSAHLEAYETLCRAEQTRRG
jgi:hypothetical protein